MRIKMSYTKRLTEKGLISPPKYVLNGIQMETQMGSIAYGCQESYSDVDIYGFCIPDKEMIFPHLRGEILGFGKQVQRFDQYQQHHIKDESNDKEYDISIYNIIKYFQLCMDNNPNMLDSLFVPRRCILFQTQIGELVRSRRKIFLHKGAFFKHKGYAYSQINKIKTKNPIGKRKEIIEKYGWDIKFGMHCIRLLNQIEQILTEEDLDLERNREQLKSIRRGEWTKEEVFEYLNTKERELETLYTKSKLRHSPDEPKIKQLLIDCLEMHFGNLGSAIVIPNQTENIIRDLEELIFKYKKGGVK
jgi:uncharacterized protein